MAFGMIQKLFTILLLEGFITISVEILTIRQLLPFFGNSVIITSIIIGFFLLFLALGYWQGGSYRQDFFQKLSRNFTLSVFWIGIGLSYALIDLFYYLAVIQFHLSYLLSLSIYLLLVLAPIVFWLGQTVPLTTNLFNQQQRVSHISGRALFLNTLGSFLGALLTALLFFQYLGVAWTIVINCVLLFALILYLRPHSHLSWRLIVALSFVLVGIWDLNTNTEQALFKKTNNYANYQVLEGSDFSRVLQMNRAFSSLLMADKKGFPYIEYIRHLLFDELALRHKKMLFIGAGGFSLSALGTHDNEIIYVDVDPQIKQIAESYFLKTTIQGSFVGEDARYYLKHSPTKFDVILSDVYSHQSTIPPALLTKEYFQALANHLNPQGLLIVNIIANPFFKDDYAKTVFNTIHAVFPYCSVLPLSPQNPISNMIYLCPLTKANTSIYSDNLNTATTDFFNSRDKSH